MKNFFFVKVEPVTFFGLFPFTLLTQGLLFFLNLMISNKSDNSTLSAYMHFFELTFLMHTQLLLKKKYSRFFPLKRFLPKTFTYIQSTLIRHKNSNPTSTNVCYLLLQFLVELLLLLLVNSRVLHTNGRPPTAACIFNEVNNRKTTPT